VKQPAIPLSRSSGLGRPRCRLPALDRACGTHATPSQLAKPAHESRNPDLDRAVEEILGGVPCPMLTIGPKACS